MKITKVKMADGTVYWKARDVGKELGFGSNGGNFSRMFTQSMFPKGMAPAKGKHWVERRANPVTNRGATCIWLTTDGLRYTLELLYYENMPHARKAVSMHAELVRMGIFKSKKRPNEFIYEETLGAAMGVRFNDDGIVTFVFLDEDDKEYPVYTRDLDPGWERKLLKAMGPKARRSR